MSTPNLESVVNHDGRLNLLCCLLDAGPLAVRQIAAQIGESRQTVGYWIKLLDSVALVAKHGESPGGLTLYVANLEAQPGWVREAVRRHRPRAV